MSKQSEEKRAYWRDVLERQRESGLSVRQFCREHQVSEASFHSWKRKIAGHDRDDAVSSESGDQKHLAKQTENAAVFIPVRVSAAAGSVLEIVHPRGHVLRVPAIFDEGSLRRVLEVLDQQGDR
jgi:transposase-like protein